MHNQVLGIHFFELLAPDKVEFVAQKDQRQLHMEGTCVNCLRSCFCFL